MPISKEAIIELQKEETGRKAVKILKLKSTPCLIKPMLDMDWAIVKPYVEELAFKSMGDFTSYSTYKELFIGRATLIIGYLLDENDVESFSQGREVEKEFVGYIIIKFEETSYHIWQLYILPKYRNAEYLRDGFDEILKDAKNTGAPTLSVSAIKDEFNNTLNRFGMKETFTIYRKDLQEKK